MPTDFNELMSLVRTLNIRYGMYHNINLKDKAFKRCLGSVTVYV